MGPKLYFKDSEVTLKTSTLFADQLRYAPFRFMPLAWVRHWFLKKAGAESGVFSYHPHLGECKRVLVFLPDDDYELFVMLPLILAVVQGKSTEDLFLVTEEKHRHLLKALGLDGKCHFGTPRGMRYGESEFSQVVNRLTSQEWDLCLFLRKDFPLNSLYLAKCSNATYRMGVGCESQYPFLNISLRPLDTTPYHLRTLLYQQFRFDPDTAAKNALKVGKHRTSAQAEPVHLSSSNVLLLNLEPPRQGSPWSSDELRRVCEALSKQFRLLALVSDPSQISPYSDLLESLQVRTAPVPATSGALFDLLRQYKGVLTLDTPHAHLFVNLSEAQVCLLQESDSPVNEAAITNTRTTVFNRGLPPYELAEKMAKLYLAP